MSAQECEEAIAAAQYPADEPRGEPAATRCSLPFQEPVRAALVRGSIDVVDPRMRRDYGADEATHQCWVAVVVVAAAMSSPATSRKAPVAPANLRVRCGAYSGLW